MEAFVEFFGGFMGIYGVVMLLLLLGATFYGLSKDKGGVFEQPAFLGCQSADSVSDGAELHRVVQGADDTAPISVVSASNGPNESGSLLIHCPACGIEVSRYAPTCPKCGQPIGGMLQPESRVVTDRSTVIVQQPMERSSNGIGTAGFVLALIALLFSWVPYVGWGVWFLGFLFSCIGMFRSPRGLAIAGFIVSIIDVIILIAVIGAAAGVLASILS